MNNGISSVPTHTHTPAVPCPLCVKTGLSDSTAEVFDELGPLLGGEKVGEGRKRFLQHTLDFLLCGAVTKSESVAAYIFFLHHNTQPPTLDVTLRRSFVLLQDHLAPPIP